MDNKQFCDIWADAQESTDRDAFMRDWSTSSSLLPPDGLEAGTDPSLLEQLGCIWDVAHMPVNEIRATTGLTQVGFAERFCVSRRTVEGWEYRGCPSHIRLMMAEVLGLINR